MTEIHDQRICALAELVDCGRNAADIGCDHGKLALLLLQKGCPRVIVSDISAPSLDKARRLLRHEGKLIETDVRLGDGLSTLKREDHISTVIIAGMGGNLITSILQQGRKKLNFIDTLLLQPQSDIPLVRNWLVENGFAVVTEKVLFNAGYYYRILKAVHAENPLKPHGWMEEEFGPLLLKEHPAILDQYLEFYIQKLEYSLSCIHADSPRAIAMKQELEQKIKDCREVTHEHSLP